MKWIIDNDRPIHNQLVEQIELRIISNYYSIGERLPSVRDLALEAKVNPNTMQKALTELEEKGLIYTKRTSGKYVTDDEKKIMKAKEKTANELVSKFIINMKRLGYDEKLLMEYLKERFDKNVIGM